MKCAGEVSVLKSHIAAAFMLQFTGQQVTHQNIQNLGILYVSKPTASIYYLKGKFTMNILIFIL